MAGSHHALQTWVLILCNHFTLLKVIWFSYFQSYSVSNLYKQILQIRMQNHLERTREEVYYQRFLEDGKLWLDAGQQIRLMAKEEVHLLSAIWCLLSFSTCHQSHFSLKSKSKYHTKPWITAFNYSSDTWGWSILSHIWKLNQSRPREWCMYWL